MASNSFRRTPSKMWWLQGIESDCHLSLKCRTSTGSPGSHKSQDSGFSDSEIAAPVRAIAHTNCQKQQPALNDNFLQEENRQQHEFTHEVIANNVLKSHVSTDIDLTPKKNLTENIKEKYTQKENLMKNLTDTRLKTTKSQKIYERHNACCRSLPQSRNVKLGNQSKLQICRSSVSKRRNENDTNVFQETYLNSGLAEICSEIRKTENQQTDVNKNLMKYFQKDFNDNITKNSEEKNVNIALTSNSQELSHNRYTKADRQNTVVPDNHGLPKLNSNAKQYLSSYQHNVDKSEFYPGNACFDLSKNENEASSNCINKIIKSRSFSFVNEVISDSENENEPLLYEPYLALKLLPHTSTPKHNFKSVSTFKTNEKKFSHEDEPGNKTVGVPSVQFWLDEVEFLYEPECMTTLQSKSIANDLARQVLHSADLLISPIKEIKRHTNIIYEEFSTIKTQLLNNKQDYASPFIHKLIEKITDFARKHIINLRANNFADIKGMEHDMNEIFSITKKIISLTSVVQDLEKVNHLLKNLKDLFCKIERNILLNQIQLLINILDEPSSHLMLRSVLSGLTSLALQYEGFAELIVEAEGPRVLLILCVECKASTIRAMALRTLATICCSAIVITQLEQVGGIEVLADILRDDTRPEPELSEATSVLVQITAPWMSDNGNIQGLSENMETLITALTNFLESTKCCQNLLLCAAALANISYMNISVIESLIRNETIGKLLNAVRTRGPKASVFLKEQCATLISNLSDIPESRNYLAENNVGVALLCFLQIYPIDIYDDAKSNAAQRLQQKSAVALSRLCSDAYVAQQIVELGGVNRLIQLCKEGKERNYSDAVLVACLAALRKIVANCGNEVMDQYDIMELVQPRLLESFLVYSSQNESYV